MEHIKHDFDKLTWDRCKRPEDKLDAIFICDRDKFPDTKHARTVGIDKNKYIKDSSNEIIYDGEYMYDDIKPLKKYKDSKILVVSGGPSAEEVDWNYEDYDYVWSMNFFYRFEKLKDKKVDLFFVGNEINTKNSDFLDYCHKHKSIIAIEDLYNRQQHIGNLFKKFPKRIVLCSSRWQAKMTGMGAKVVIFALCMRAKEVHYVGLDGITKELKFEDEIKHSFQGRKVFRKKKQQSHEQVRKQYVALEEHLKDTFPHAIVKNLGKQSKLNCLYEGDK
tara:strand:+ start:4287 stop:5114 length:828 start_codon:yes stop_codon:yes gene_type:complete